MDRREYLAAFGVASISGLTGCNLLSGTTGSESQPTIVEGPAQFTEFKIEAPKQATVDTSVSVTVSAFNYGSKAGGTTVTLATVKGAETVSKQVELTDVDSGTRGKGTVDLTFSVSDEFVLGVFDTSAVALNPDTSSAMETATPPSGTPKTKSKLTIGPKKKSIGKAFDLEQLRVTLTDVTYQYGVRYNYKERSTYEVDPIRQLVAPQTGNVLAVLRFKIENTEAETATFDPKGFSIPHGTVLTDLNGEYNLNEADNVKGNTVADTSVDPGKVITGWLLVEVPSKRVKQGTQVRWQRDAHKTTPERVWTLPPKKLPSFDLISWKGTDQTAGQHNHTITVKNSSKTKGTFYGIIDVKFGGEWKVHRPFKGMIAPDKTKTFEVQTFVPYPGSVTYRLRPFGKTRPLTLKPPTMSFGKSDYRDAFTVMANGTTYQTVYPGHGSIASPVKGQLYTKEKIEKVKPGGSWSGWIVFEVSSSVSPSNATIVLDKEYTDGTATAKWKKESTTPP